MISFIEKLATYFYKIAKAKPIFLYHGTSKDRLKSILSQGLIPNPSVRAWKEDPDASFYQVSRQSLGGVYLTDNLLTAMGAARNASSSEVRELRYKQPIEIIIVQVQPQSLYIDEDNVPRISSIYLPGMTTHETWTYFLYILSVIKPTDSWVNQAKREYIDANLSGIQSYFGKKNINIKFKDRLIKLLHKGWELSLKRKASYADEYEFKSAKYRAIEENPAISEDIIMNIPIPNTSQAEMEFKKFQDVFTRTLKTLARTHFDTINFTARVTDPIGYTKSNKIVAIFEQYNDENRKKQIKLIYPSSIDKVPIEAVEKFKKDWNKQISYVEDFKLG